MGCRYVVVNEYTVTKYGCPQDMWSGGQNLAEAAVWERVKDTNLGRYFAPVLSCEPDGSKLVMMRVKPLEPDDAIRADAFYDMLALLGWREQDPQTDNVGELDGRTVALDYGYHLRLKNTNADVLSCRECECCKNYGKVER